MDTYSLEPSIEKRETLLQAINQYTQNFLESLPDQKAYVGNQYEKNSLDESFAIDGKAKPIESLLALLEARVDGTGLNPASGGHLGYIPGGGLFTSALGDYISALTNRYAGIFYSSPGAVRIENELIQWVGRLIGFSSNFGGNLTSGGSMANTIALSAAKAAKKIKSKDIETSVIYTTKQSHHSILKALRLIGLDECVLRYIPLDSHFTMQTQALQTQIQEDKKVGLRPFLIIANAGSTDVGAVDDISSLVHIAQQEDLWLHIDAAYGGFFLLTEYGKEKLKDLSLVDSVVLDPHKTLFLPYGSGMVLVKHVDDLLRANNYEAGYMQDAKGWELELSPAELSPELSRNFRGLRMWLPLQLHGLQPFVDNLNEKLQLTQYFCQAIQKIGFEIGTEPDLTVVIYRYQPTHPNSEVLNRKILKYIQEQGNIFISSTTIDGVFWLRAAIVSFRTHLKEVDTLISLLSEGVKEALP